MIEAYAVGVVAKLEDQVTPGMLRIIEMMGRASARAIEFGAALRGLSLNGAALAKNLDKAWLAAGKFGDSPGLTAANARLDTMAAASAQIARNLEAAKAAGAGVGGPAGRYPSGSGGNSNTGPYKSKAATQAAGLTGLAVLGGVYENARLDDTNIKAIATSQLPFGEWGMTMEKLRAKEFEYASKYAFATGGRIEPFGEAMLNSSRLLRTMPQGKQEQMLDTAMPYAAIEAKLKDVPLPEALEAFIGLAHQAGAYSESEAKPLFGAMVQASLTTHSSLDEIARAASYALPALHAAGANSADTMLMIATMQQAGIMNTKSGTWINAMATNALPNTLGSGLFRNENQNKALHELGLYKGNQAQFYRNGQFNLMQEVALLAEARERMGALKFNAASRLAFGVQGQRAASIFSEETTLDNLHALQALKNQEQKPSDVEGMINRMSAIAKADQTIANANMTLMNASATFTGPVNWLLDKASGAAQTTADYTKENPGTGLAGLAAGGIALGVIGKLLWKGAASLITKLEGVVVRALGSVLTFALEGAATAISAAGGLLGILGGAALGGLALAIGAGIGYCINEAFEKITGKSIGTAIFDHMNLDEEAVRKDEATNALQAKSIAEWRKRHQGTPHVPAPPTQKPAAAQQGAAPTKSNDQASVTHVHLHVDSKEIASIMIPEKTMGTTDFNMNALGLSPSSGAYGLS